MNRHIAKKATIMLGLSYITNSAYMVTVERASLSEALKYILAVFLTYFVFQAIRDFVHCSRIISRNTAFVEEQLACVDQASENTSRSGSVFEIFEDSRETISIEPRDSMAVRGEQIMTNSSASSVSSGQQANIEGFDKFLDALYLKRSMLDWNFCVTFVITLFGVVSIFVTANIWEDSSQLTPILDSRGQQRILYGRGLYKLNAEIENTPKVSLMLVRESIMLVCLLALCVVMRPREHYPSFFDSPLSEDPEQHGVRAFDGDGLF